MGQFIAHVGPQRTFVVPNGVLDPRGRNTLALAVTSDGAPDSGLEKVALHEFSIVRGGVAGADQVALVRSPAFDSDSARGD